MGTVICATPWGNMTRGGVIMGAVASPMLVGRRLSHGNGGSREVAENIVLSHLLGYKL